MNMETGIRSSADSTIKYLHLHTPSTEIIKIEQPQTIQVETGNQIQATLEDLQKVNYFGS